MTSYDVVQRYFYSHRVGTALEWANTRWTHSIKCLQASRGNILIYCRFTMAYNWWAFYGVIR